MKTIKILLVLLLLAVPAQAQTTYTLTGQTGATLDTLLNVLDVDSDGSFVDETWYLNFWNVTLATQTANTIFAGPTTGAAAAPTYRVMVAADIPNDLINSQHYTADSIDAEHISDWYAYSDLLIALAADGAAAPDALDDRTTRPPYQYRTFAGDSTEDVNFVWFVPSDLSGATIQFRVKYLVTAATGPSAEGVAFTLAGVSIGDGVTAGVGDPTNAVKGTAVTVTDTALTAAQWDILISDWSGDVTVTDLAAGEVAELAFTRDHDHASDDYAQLLGVLAVEIRYVQNVAK